MNTEVNAKEYLYKLADATEEMGEDFDFSDTRTCALSRLPLIDVRNWDLNSDGYPITEIGRECSYFSLIGELARILGIKDKKIIRQIYYIFTPYTTGGEERILTFHYLGLEETGIDAKAPQVAANIRKFADTL